MQCVYKPVAGEQPLWDFPDGTLAGREVAAYLISEALGWKIVPPTIIRQGPAGPGMIQLWVEQPDDPDGAGLVDLCPANAVPPGYLSVLTAGTTPVPKWRWCTPTTRGCGGWRCST